MFMLEAVRLGIPPVLVPSVQKKKLLASSYMIGRVYRTVFYLSQTFSALPWQDTRLKIFYQQQEAISIRINAPE